jgi:hypothetical protein
MALLGLILLGGNT